MKKLLSIFVTVIALCTIFAFVGCKDEKDTRQHVTLLVYDNKNSSEILCELSEENNRQTITVEYRALTPWDFKVKAKFPHGNYQLDNANSVHRSFGKYVSPRGEELTGWSEIVHKGTYECIFTIENNNKLAFPFQAFLIVEVV